MPQLVTRYQHPADSCPAADLTIGSMLLQHLSPENATKSGISIHEESVVQNHTLFLILEAPSIERVQEFMTPFAQAGSVEIREGSSCSTVVARRTCGSRGQV